MPATGCTGTARTCTLPLQEGAGLPGWENPHQDGEGFDLPPIQFTPGLELTSQHSLPGWCDDKFEVDGHKLEEVESSVRGASPRADDRRDGPSRVHAPFCSMGPDDGQDQGGARDDLHIHSPYHPSPGARHAVLQPRRRERAGALWDAASGPAGAAAAGGGQAAWRRCLGAGY